MHHRLVRDGSVLLKKYTIFNRRYKVVRKVHFIAERRSSSTMETNTSFWATPCKSRFS